MFKGVNAIDFARRFPNNETCLRLLEEKKWKTGYRCVRCGCNEHVKGRTSFHRRCRTCAYDESVTANTIFHDMHLPMMKAFFLLFRIVTKKKGMSTVELASEVGVHRKTAWLFKRKVQAAIRGRNTNRVSFDELMIDASTSPVPPPGGPKQMCVLDPKQAYERDRPRKAGTVEMVNPDRDSLKRLGFSGRGVYMMLFKIWLRGIHHKCSKALFFAYCDEFWFRQRYRSNRERIFESSLSNVLLSAPQPYAVLKCSSA